jgi:hypothetical protein
MGLSRVPEVRLFVVRATMAAFFCESLNLHKLHPRARDLCKGANQKLRAGSVLNTNRESALSGGLGGDYDRSAGRFYQASVSVFLQRVEID